MSTLQQNTITTKKPEKSNASKVIIVILSLLLLALAYFAYKNYKDNKESEATLLEEKLNIQSDLDSKIIELDNAIADNTSIKSELLEAKNNIVAFRDSVKNLKTLNFQVIRRYKNKLAVLERANRKLLQTADSLKRANYELAVERDSAQAKVVEQATRIVKQTQKNDSLVSKNTELYQTLKKGAALKIGNVKVIAMKERSSGKLRETTRARKTDAFRISFIVRANTIADQGNRKAYIVIQDATGKVLSEKGTFTDIDSNEVHYTDDTEFSYSNDDLEIILLSKINEEKLSKGDYYVKVYLEGKYLGQASIYLK